MISEKTEKHINRLVGCADNIYSIWLFGSRANGSSTNKSDWDLFVFTNEEGLKTIRRSTELKNDHIDLLVVFDENNFCDPWPEEDELEKNGDLEMWKWKIISPNEATYESIKYLSDEWYKSKQAVSKQLSAFKIWPKST